MIGVLGAGEGAGEHGEGVQQVLKLLAVEHHEGLADGGFLVGVLDQLAVGLAELAQEVAVRRGGAQVGGAQDDALAVVGVAGEFLGVVLGDAVALPHAVAAGFPHLVEAGAADFQDGGERLVEVQFVAVLAVEHEADFLGEIGVGLFLEFAGLGKLHEFAVTGFEDDVFDGFIDGAALVRRDALGGADAFLVPGFLGFGQVDLSLAHFGGEFLLQVGDFFGARGQFSVAQGGEGEVHPADADEQVLALQFGFLAGFVGAGFVKCDQGVPDLLRAHAAHEGAGEIIRLAQGQLLVVGGALVGVGVHEGAQVGLHVVVDLFHEVFQVAHEGGVGGHGGVGQFIDRLDDALAHDFFPQAVGDDEGEARVVRGGHPFGITGDRRFAFLGDIALLGEGGGDEGLDGVARLGVGVGVVMRQTQGAVAVDDGVEAQGAEDFGHGPAQHVAIFPGEAGEFFVRLQAVTAGVRATDEAVGALDAEGVGGHLVVVHHGPFVEGVVVALGADHLGAEEDLGGHGHVVELHVVVPDVEADGAVLIGLAFGGDQLMHELVVRFVFGQTLFDPLGVGGAGSVGSVEQDVLVTEDVRPVVEVMLHVAVGGEQGVDQLGAFVRRGVGQEFLGFLECGDAAHGVEVNPAQEDVVAGHLVGREFLLLQFLEHQGVDFLGGLGHVERAGGQRGKTNGGERQQGGQPRATDE